MTWLVQVASPTAVLDPRHPVPVSIADCYGGDPDAVVVIDFPDWVPADTTGMSGRIEHDPIVASVSEMNRAFIQRGPV